MFVFIKKAKKNTKNIFTRAQLNAIKKIYNKHFKLFSTSLKDTFKNFSNEISKKKFIETLAAQGTEAGISELTQKKLIEKLNEVSDSAFTAAMTDTINKMGVIHTIKKPTINFNSSNSRVVQYIKNSVGNLIQNISTQTLTQVRNLFIDSMRIAKPVDELAMDLKNIVGLLPEQQQKYFELKETSLKKLEAQGVSRNEALKQVETKLESFYNRQLDIRAKRIARTETSRIVNEGQMEIYRQMSEAGIIDIREAKKQWVIFEDTACSICEPLDGTIVGFNDFFETQNGAVSTPPLHPNCNCTVILLYE
jgi:SPP1 gp7 family putative phage head morphogenesis protein